MMKQLAGMPADGLGGGLWGRSRRAHPQRSPCSPETAALVSTTGPREALNRRRKGFMAAGAARSINQ